MKAQLPCIHPNETWNERTLAFETIEVLSRLGAKAIQENEVPVPPTAVISTVAERNVATRAREIHRQMDEVDLRDLRLPASPFVASLYIGKNVYGDQQDDYPLIDTFPSREVHALGKIGSKNVLDGDIFELYRSIFISCNPDFRPVHGPRRLKVKVGSLIVDDISGEEWVSLDVKETIQRLHHPDRGIYTRLTSRLACAVNLSNIHLRSQELESLKALSTFRQGSVKLKEDEAGLHKDGLRNLIVDSDERNRCGEPIVFPVMQTVYQLLEK